MDSTTEVLASQGASPELPSTLLHLGELPLDDLAARANAKHQEAFVTTKTAFDRWVEVGEILIAAKAKVGHGGWGKWVETNLSFDLRQAQKYMRVAARAPELMA